MNKIKHQIADMYRCLKLGTIPVQIKRCQRGYKAFMPASITKDGGVETLSHVELTSGPCPNKTELKLHLCQRYEAEVFMHTDTVYIRPRYAMKSPRWGGRFGALPELTHYARRAKLI